MREWIGFIIFWIVIYFVFTGDFLFQGTADKLSEPEVLIGEQVIMKGDTLMITDYSIIKQTYILENGVELNKKLAEKLLLKTAKRDGDNVHPPDEVDEAEDDWSDDGWD